MKRNTKGIGKQGKEKGKALSHGLMVVSSLGLGRMICESTEK